MKCEQCGLELAVKRWDSETDIFYLVCRNKQCPAHEVVLPVTEAELAQQ